MARVLITNGGSHTPDNWAIATAEQIVQIDPAMAGDRLLAAEKLKLSFAEALAPHHAKVQQDERERLAKDSQHILSAYDAENYLDDCLKDLTKAAQGTPWQAHFADSGVQRAVREVLLNHLQTSQNGERHWHADNNPDCEYSRAFKGV